MRTIVSGRVRWLPWAEEELVAVTERDWLLLVTTRDRDLSVTDRHQQWTVALPGISLFFPFSSNHAFIVFLLARIKNRAPAAFQVPHQIMCSARGYCSNLFLFPFRSLLNSFCAMCVLWPVILGTHLFIHGDGVGSREARISVPCSKAARRRLRGAPRVSGSETRGVRETDQANQGKHVRARITHRWVYGPIRHVEKNGCNTLIGRCARI